MEKYNYQFPRLTREELEFFKKKDGEFFKQFNLEWPLYKKIGNALQTLAVAKLIGGYQGIYIVNKEEAIQHHLKACVYNPSIIYKFPIFKKEASLLVYERCE